MLTYPPNVDAVWDPCKRLGENIGPVLRVKDVEDPGLRHAAVIGVLLLRLNALEDPNNLLHRHVRRNLEDDGQDVRLRPSTDERLANDYSTTYPTGGSRILDRSDRKERSIGARDA